MTWSMFSSNTASCAPFPSMVGAAPAPYVPIVTGAAALPEPCGMSVPVQVEPRAKSSESPGGRVIALAWARFWNGWAWVPSPGPVVLLQSTK